MDAVVGKMTQLTVEAQQCSGPDPEGDVVLKCQDHDTGTMMSFRVSSKVLRLASPVFVRMFSSSFREGHELLQEECVVVELEDDDASLMNILLNVLHYQAGYEDHVIDAEKLARLAIHCDKYDCTKALAPWVSIWFKDIKEPGQPPVDFGFQILAAYMFNNAKKFEEISKAALEEMAPEFSAQWMQQDILKLLPDRISDVMTWSIRKQINKMEAELQSTESLLRENRRCYDTSQLICVICGRTLPEEAKQCRPCHNGLLPPKYCTSETRVAEYFGVLRKVDLWPTAVSFRTCSISDIAFRFTCTKSDLRHRCAAGNSCPLLLSLNSLLDRISQIQRCIEGFCLPCIRQDEDWTNNTACSH